MARLKITRPVFKARAMWPTLVGVVLVGTVAVVLTLAASGAIGFEPEAGTLAKGATAISVAGQSGAGVVRFGPGATPTPTPTAVPTAAPTTPTPTPAPSAAPAARSLNCVPAVNATMTNNVSHLCGFPDYTNTGVPAGTVLKRVPQDITAPDATTGHGWSYDSRGWINVDQAGGVIQNISVVGMDINITADNATVQRVRVRGTSTDSFGISIRHGKNATIQDSEVSGTNSTSQRMLVGVKDIYGDGTGATIQRNNIYWVSTGIQIDHGLVQDNYIHDMGFVSGDHVNGTTSNGGTTLLTIRHNTSFNQFNQTDAISLFEDFGVQANRVIDNNLVAGGGYCIYGGQNAGGPAASNIKITNNHFSRLYYPGCGSYGTVAAWPINGAGGVFTGNIWDDTGAAVSG